MSLRDTGIDTQAASTTVQSVYVTTTRSSSWAPAAPLVADALTQPTGLPELTASPTVQSSRFFNEPGSAPAYSGVENRTASAVPSRRRRSATSGGNGSMSSSGLKWGSVATPS